MLNTAQIRARFAKSLRLAETSAVPVGSRGSVKAYIVSKKEYEALRRKKKLTRARIAGSMTLVGDVENFDASQALEASALKPRRKK